MPRLLGLLLVGAALAVWGGGPSWAGDDENEVKSWEEAEVHFPAVPKESDLTPFYVSASTDNRFFVDSSSIAVGRDGVVRYTLVVVSGSGVRNVSFEGMRCETRERRLYAFGHSDGTWSKSRRNQWEPVREAVSNRQYAALFHEVFCPVGVIVRNAAEAREALRRNSSTSALLKW